MRFVALRLDGRSALGVVEAEEVRVLPPEFGDLVSVAEGGPSARAGIESLLRSGTGRSVPFGQAELLSPIGRFRRNVLCTGWNYWEHFEEGRAHRPDVERPLAPTFFTKSPDAVIGPRDPIAFDPDLSAKWDYEAELAVVIGTTGRSIPRERALDHVFGYTLANDVSTRDLQRRHGGQWFKGKSIDGTCPLGPVVVTPEEIDLGTARIQCLVNGETRQDARVAQMAFPLAELIAELSLGMTLHAGDVLLTGTPSGVGNARKPPVYLQEGDEVVVRLAGIGELRNRVTRADLCGRSDLVPLRAEA